MRPVSSISGFNPVRKPRGHDERATAEGVTTVKVRLPARDRGRILPMSGYATRVDTVAPFLAMEVMERGMTMARGGLDVIQLGVGEPGFPSIAPTWTTSLACYL